MSTRPLLIVGAGPVGQTLGRLFAHAQQLHPWAVVNRSAWHAQEAAAFVGEGVLAVTALEALGPLPQTTVILLATADRDIEAVALNVVKAGLVVPGRVVFHVSGALSSAALAACARAGALTASMHPLASFADPLTLSRRFAGVYCASEGHEQARAVLEPAFAEIGARVVRIASSNKALYHAGAVLASGHLVTLLASAQAALAESGLEGETALALLRPLVEQSLANAFSLGPLAAMTGPLVRGDEAVIRMHAHALRELDPALAACYEALTSYAAKRLGRNDPLASPLALSAATKTADHARAKSPPDAPGFAPSADAAADATSARDPD